MKRLAILTRTAGSIPEIKARGGWIGGRVVIGEEWTCAAGFRSSDVGLIDFTLQSSLIGTVHSDPTMLIS